MLNKLRYKILEISFLSKEGHIGSSYSILEILYVVVKKFLINNRVDFILSKGHAALGLYVIFNHFKIISDRTLLNFSKLNSQLGGHPDSTKIDKVIFSTGSLGHGFPCAAGLGLAYKLKKKKETIICLVGDQELLEGTTWETLFFIQSNKIDNIILLIDKNNSDFRSTKIDDLKRKMNCFSEKVFSIDGHDLKILNQTLELALKFKKFTIIIANTIKGKGIKLMENNPEWHHKIPSRSELKTFKKILKI